MPIVTVTVGSKAVCRIGRHRRSKGTRPAQEQLRDWSAEETSLMCLRGFVCLCIGEVVEDASFHGVQRASLGTELGPFSYS